MNKGFLCQERLLYGPWPALERNIARLLPYLQFDNVQLIGGPYDQGADVLAHLNGEKWVFQVKFTRGTSIGAVAISEVLEAGRFYGAQRGTIVTNSFFSKEAYIAKETLTGSGIKIELWDGALLAELYSRIEEFPPVPWPLYPYQEQAILALRETFLNPNRHNALIVMATGLGKTYVVANFISTITRDDPETKVLVLAHVKELVHQLEKAFWPHLNKHIATHIWTGEEKPSFSEGITFATIQSIASNTSNAKRGQFDIIIVDEAHHIGSETYQQTINFLSPKFLIGITATPWRLDKFKLSAIFGEPSFSISIVEGMNQGYLAEVEYRMLIDDINWDEFKKITRGQYSINELNRRLFLPGRDQAVVGKIKEHWDDSKKPRAIVFCRSIQHAQRMTGMLNAAGFCNSYCISSATPRRERDIILNKFRDGKIDVLVTVDLLNEGIDVPEVNLIAFLRVTHSRRIFVQQLGRGLRLSKGKTHVKVLDFVADIRRIAAGLDLEEEHEEFKRQHPNIIHIPNRIVQFTNDKAMSLFKEWLADIANVQDADEQSRLEFPPP